MPEWWLTVNIWMAKKVMGTSFWGNQKWPVLNLSQKTCQSITDHLTFFKNKTFYFQCALNTLCCHFTFNTISAWSAYLSPDSCCFTTGNRSSRSAVCPLIWSIVFKFLVFMMDNALFYRLSFPFTNQQSLVKLVRTFIHLEVSVCFKWSTLFCLTTSERKSVYSCSE